MHSRFSDRQNGTKKRGNAFPTAARTAACLASACVSSPFPVDLSAAPASISAAAQTPQTDPEASLKERMNRFYDCYVSGEFRKAEQYVAPDSKDSFYSAAKERISSYRISRIDLDENARDAKVIVVVNGPIPLGGQVLAADLPLASEWKRIDGQWYWSAPVEQQPRMPMGPVSSPVSPSAVLPSSTDINHLAQNLPRDFSSLGVPILDKPVLTLNASSKFQDVTHLANLSKAPLKFRVEYAPIPGVRLVPLTGDLPPGGSVEITAEASPGASTIHQTIKREGRIMVSSGASANLCLTIQFYVQIITD